MTTDGSAAQETPTFCDAVVTIRFDESEEEVACSDRYGHGEAHSAKIWWANDE